jgi:hypothetical protein
MMTVTGEKCIDYLAAIAYKAATDSSRFSSSLSVNQTFRGRISVDL